MDTVTLTWSQPFEGSPYFIWEQKLKNTKFALKSWAKKKSLSTPMSTRQKVVQTLAEIQLGMEGTEITKSQLLLEQNAQLNYFLSF